MAPWYLLPRLPPPRPQVLLTLLEGWSMASHHGKAGPVKPGRRHLMKPDPPAGSSALQVTGQQAAQALLPLLPRPLNPEVA